MTFKNGDCIILNKVTLFVQMDQRNGDVIDKFLNTPLVILKINDSGNATKFKTKQGTIFEFTITSSELSQCFVKHTEHGEFKIIITYVEEGKTIEEEGVFYINVTNSQFEYHYNRKRMGFLKYKGEVSVELKDLKQITLSTPVHERVLHIEKGIIVREHIMYDNERKFSNIEYGA